ncbi:MAG: BatA and WFA domain-containing protein [Candidatus Nanoarchaeia archaeon]|nr:BatA and WFA domain-containing protein [Candidatus Nanoarchaeia archaeon]
MPIANTLGLFAFLALIPLIIIYLRRPKPLEKVIPSLMFFMKGQKHAAEDSFFKKILRNLLFLIQILVICLIALSIASPYLITSEKATSENTVIIIDTSASSQALTNGATRFEKSIDIAKDYFQGRISIISASDAPETMLEDGTRNQATAIINAIKPKDTPTNIESSLYEAESILQEKKGRIVVISDFLVEDINELFKAKRIISSKGIDVEFVSTWSDAENVGIVGLDVNKYNVVVDVKNFNDEEVEITAAVIKDEIALDRKSKKISAKSKEKFDFETPTGISQIVINSNDDFKLDDIVYISAPEKKHINVLLITNSETSYIMKALESFKDVNLEIVQPPIVRGIESNDIIIIADIDIDLILPGTFEEISREVGNGKSLIINTQEGIEDMGISWLLPVEINGRGNNTKACVKLINEITNQFDNDRCFTTAKKYFKSSIKQDSISLIEADDSSPLFAIGSRGEGKIVYYGILDEQSDFNTQTSYPIFWNDLLNYLAGVGDINDYNFMIQQKPKIKKVGFYENENKDKIAVNLINELESDVGIEIMPFENSEFVPGISQENVALDLDLYLITIAILLMFFEILYIKSRGDL